ncbi:MAG: LAGLIDADG family homing endonuclease [Candidatus Paceibacterota bacterium]
MYDGDTTPGELGALVDKHSVPKNGLSYEYIRGLVDGEGCFTFYPGYKNKSGRKSKLPAFVLAMNERDKKLIELVRDALGLRNKIYIRNSSDKDGHKRSDVAVLVVREFDQLKDIIIPFFYGKLRGYKGEQFIAWLEKIGSDPDVSDRYKSLYRLYKWGIFGKLSKFTEKFKD